MHWLFDEGFGPTVIEFPLSPIVRFLLVKPSLRKCGSAKRSATSLEEDDHRQGVVTLW